MRHSLGWSNGVSVPGALAKSTVTYQLVSRHAVISTPSGGASGAPGVENTKLPVS